MTTTKKMGHDIETYLRTGVLMLILKRGSVEGCMCACTDVCGFDTMGVLPDWCCSLTCCLLCLLRGAVWVAHLLERSAISGADVSWEPFN